MNLWGDGTGFNALSGYGKWQFVEKWREECSAEEIAAFCGKSTNWVGRIAHLRRLAGYNIPRRLNGTKKVERVRPAADIRIVHRNGAVSTVGSGDRDLAESWAEAWRREVV